VEEREGATSTSATTSTNTNTSTSRLHLHLRLQHSITTYSVAKDNGKLSLPKTVRGRAIVAAAKTAWKSSTTRMTRPMRTWT
jgi:hypothetical protein